MDLGAALIGLGIAMIVKVAVMILAGRILFRLYRSRHTSPPKKPWLLLPKEDTSEIRILWWSLVLFAASELTCGIEIYIIFHSSAILSGSHSILSGLGMGLFATGFVMLLDRRFLHYGEPGCIANRVCRGCTIGEAEGCKFRAVLLLAGTFVALAACAPFLAKVERMGADVTRYITPFGSLNAWYDGSVVPWLKAHYPDYKPSGEAYYMPWSAFYIEFRILPAIALVVAAAGIVLTFRRREVAGIRALSFAAGMLAYVYMELILYRASGDVLLGSLGHEIAEFWFLVFTAELLHRLYGPQTAAAPALAEAPAHA